MTIAIAINVHDGLVLASDSAMTLVDRRGANEVTNVYNNANKIYNLYKGLPIGGITWGAGSIGASSIATLAKDFRRMLHGAEFHGGFRDFKKDEYTIEHVARLLRAFLDERYQAEYRGWPEERRPSLGFLVAGYSSGASQAEGWLVEWERGGQCKEPRCVLSAGQASAYWNGETEVVTRILHGHGLLLPEVLARLGVPDDKLERAVEVARDMLHIPLVTAPMPIQDVIDLAEFLVHAATMFARFRPGATTVGGAIEVAAITKHEDFKWIRRKHYFDAEHNRDILWRRS